MVVHHQEFMQLARLPDLQGNQPSWVWDLATGRIVWANEQALQWGHARTVSDLTRLRFLDKAEDKDNTGWMATLSQLAKKIQPGSKVREKIEFIKGQEINCQLKAIHLENGHSALVITLLPAPAPTPGPATKSPEKIAKKTEQKIVKRTHTSTSSKEVASTTSKKRSPTSKAARQKKPPLKSGAEKTPARKTATTTRKKAATKRKQTEKQKKVTTCVPESIHTSDKRKQSVKASPSEIEKLQACLKQHISGKSPQGKPEKSGLKQSGTRMSIDMDGQKKPPKRGVGKKTGRNNKATRAGITLPKRADPYSIEDSETLDAIARQIRGKSQQKNQHIDDLNTEASSLANTQGSSHASRPVTTKATVEGVNNPKVKTAQPGAGNVWMARESLRQQDMPPMDTSRMSKMSQDQLVKQQGNEHLTEGYHPDSLPETTPLSANIVSNLSGQSANPVLPISGTCTIASQQGFMDTLPVATLLCSSSGHVITCNHIFLSIFGLSDLAHLYRMGGIECLLPGFTKDILEACNTKGLEYNENCIFHNIISRNVHGFESLVHISASKQFYAQPSVEAGLMLVVYPAPSPLQNPQTDQLTRMEGLKYTASSSQYFERTEDIKKPLYPENRQSFSPRQNGDYTAAEYGSSTDFSNENVRHDAIRFNGEQKETDNFPSLTNVQKPQNTLQPVESTEYLARLGHEVRTPLNSILGFSELIKSQKMGPLNNTKYLRYVEDIHVSARHALDLINDLLEMSRLNAGAVELLPEPVDLKRNINIWSRTLLPQLMEKQLQLELSGLIPEMHVLADMKYTRQVVLNIVENAIKYAPPATNIQMATHWYNNKQIVLTIENTGTLLSQQEIDEIMQPFGRLPSDVHSGIQGTGLGLPLVRELMLTMGGHFYITSHPNSSREPHAGQPGQEGRVIAHLVFNASSGRV